MACDRTELGEKQVRETAVREHKVVKIAWFQITGTGLEVSGNQEEDFVREVE